MTTVEVKNEFSSHDSSSPTRKMYDFGDDSEGEGYIQTAYPLAKEASKDANASTWMKAHEKNMFRGRFDEFIWAAKLGLPKNEKGEAITNITDINKTTLENYSSRKMIEDSIAMLKLIEEYKNDDKKEINDDLRRFKNKISNPASVLALCLVPSAFTPYGYEEPEKINPPDNEVNYKKLKDMFESNKELINENIGIDSFKNWNCMFKVCRPPFLPARRRDLHTEIDMIRGCPFENDVFISPYDDASPAEKDSSPQKKNSPVKSTCVECEKPSQQEKNSSSPMEKILLEILTKEYNKQYRIELTKQVRKTSKKIIKEKAVADVKKFLETKNLETIVYSLE